MPPFFVDDMTDEQKAEYFAYLNKTKGGYQMACTHDEIKCVNCVKTCLKCGAELPADFVPGKPAPVADKAAETPENGMKKRTRKKE